MTRARPTERPASPRRTRVSRPAARPRARARRKPPPFRLPPVRPRFAVLMLAAIAIAGFGVLWLPSAPFSFPRQTRLWRGYQTLVVRVGTGAEAALPAALARMGRGVVSEWTTAVDFYDFSGSARVSLHDLSRRLDPLDPRRDAYIDRLAGYFTVTSGEADWRAAYIPARASSLVTYLKLRQLLGPPAGGAWRLVELDPLEKVLSIAAVLAFTILVSSAAPRRPRATLLVALLGAVLWVPSLLGGGLSVLALCFALLLAWFPLAREWLLVVTGESAGPDGVLRRFVAFAGAGVLGISILLGLEGWERSRLLTALSPALASLLLLAAVAFFRAAADSWRRRRMRVPVFPVRDGADVQKGRSLGIIVALFSLTLVALLPLVRGGAYPSPVPVAGARDFSWQSVERLAARRSAERLPDFSDYVAHEAYQQALGFGRSWAFPSPGERVYRHEYLLDPATGRVHARLRTVKVFDSAWLSSVVRGAAAGTVEGLLSAQGRPVEAAVQRPAGPLSRTLPFTILVFCVLFALLGKDLGLGPLIRANLWRFNSEARRDQVP